MPTGSTILYVSMEVIVDRGRGGLIAIDTTTAPSARSTLALFDRSRDRRHGTARLGSARLGEINDRTLTINGIYTALAADSDGRLFAIDATNDLLVAVARDQYSLDGRVSATQRRLPSVPCEIQNI